MNGIRRPLGSPVVAIVMGLLCCVLFYPGTAQQVECPDTDLGPDDLVSSAPRDGEEGQQWVVDPWIRPPRGSCQNQALGKLGDFEGYPEIHAGCNDTIKFIMRPINRELGENEDGSPNLTGNQQRHGVYLVQFKSPEETWTRDPTLGLNLVDYIKEHRDELELDHEAGVWGDFEKYLLPSPDQEVPCRAPINAPELGLPCSIEDPRCLGFSLLDPMRLIHNESGVIEFETRRLGDYVSTLEAENPSGFDQVHSRRTLLSDRQNMTMVFSCPWVQGGAGGGRSHCLGGMWLRVHVDLTMCEINDAVDGTREEHKQLHHAKAEFRRALRQTQNSCDGSRLSDEELVSSSDIEGGAKMWRVDPFIIPPRGNCAREALTKPGDFERFPDIHAGCDDVIEFDMPPVNRAVVDGEGNIDLTANAQRHGVSIVHFPTTTNPEGGRGSTLKLGELLREEIMKVASQQDVEEHHTVASRYLRMWFPAPEDDIPCPASVRMPQLGMPCTIEDPRCLGYNMVSPMRLISNASQVHKYLSRPMRDYMNDAIEKDGEYHLIMACPWPWARGRGHCEQGMWVRVIVKDTCGHEGMVIHAAEPLQRPVRFTLQMNSSDANGNGGSESMDALATELRDILQVRMPLGTQVNKPQLRMNSGSTASVSAVTVKEQDLQNVEVEAATDFADGTDEGVADKIVDEVEKAAKDGSLFSSEFRSRFGVQSSDGGASPSPDQNDGTSRTSAAAISGLNRLLFGAMLVCSILAAV